MEKINQKEKNEKNESLIKKDVVNQKIQQNPTNYSNELNKNLSPLNIAEI